MRDSYKYAGQTVRLKSGEEFKVEDWCENVLGRSWMAANGNPAALQYAVRRAGKNLPIDNDVLYGKIGGMGLLVHESELEGLE